MRHTFQHEIDYLGTLGGEAGVDRKLLEELRYRLDTLRRFDQNFCDNDSRPSSSNDDWPRDCLFNR
jgi:hypothetical protein